MPASVAPPSTPAHQAPGRKEIDAALQILQMLRLKRRNVTADALFCSRAFARTVLDQGGDYVLALKRNQGKLFASVVSRLAHTGERDTAQQLLHASHDRRERRDATVMHDNSLAAKHKFPGIAAIARVTSWRTCDGAPADKPFARYFLLSQYLCAARLLAIVGRTGRSRTPCTGCSMSTWRKMPGAPEPTPPPRISACCAGWR